MTVLTGVKAPFELTQYAIAIKQQGIDFAIRHYTHQAGKSLSLAEARALTEAGIQIGVVWETPDVHPSYFSRAQGCADGAAAYLMAQAMIAQPSGSAIYFAAPEASGCDAATRYFEGVNQAFGAAGPAERKYQVGVYGAAICCDTMMARGLATVAWLADAHAGADYNLTQLQAASLPVDDGQRINVGMVRNSPDRPAGLFRVL
ncbi:glycoside hydrolase domain-containing protein [Duganella sp. P38]|uniref:glycoside hydrolase domain-containing protein n=1 Tax=Duganella sp. P38 TaxID=3423949 RepID=UPI003D7959A0